LIRKLTLARERPTFSFYSLLSFLLDKSDLEEIAMEFSAILVWSKKNEW